MPSVSKSLISDAEVAHFHDEGYVLLESVIPEELLALLRGACQSAIDQVDAEMDAQGVDVLGLNLRGRRYFSINTSYTHPELYRFILSPLMAELTQGLLGDTVHVFWEQYVVKGPERGNAFAWHQDSAYVGFPHAPYLTCWCALDDMSEANGTARILPTSVSGVRELVSHEQDAETNDLIGYHGDEPGIPIICPAGSIACFSSHTLHSSGINRSPDYRRTYLIQYSSEVIRKPGDWKPYGRCEPFIVGGRQVLKPA